MARDNLRAGQFENFSSRFTKRKPTEVCHTTERLQTKKHCVFEAAERARRRRGVFGIPHTAAKVNNQLFLRSKNKGPVTVEGGNIFHCEGGGAGAERTINNVMV